MGDKYADIRKKEQQDGRRTDFECLQAINCPVCGTSSKRHSTVIRCIRDFCGKYQVIVSRHWCTSCKKHFTNPALLDVVASSSRWSREVIGAAIGLCRQGKTLPVVADELRKRGAAVPVTTLHDWWRSVLREEREKESTI